MEFPIIPLCRNTLIEQSHTAFKNLCLIIIYTLIKKDNLIFIDICKYHVTLIAVLLTQTGITIKRIMMFMRSMV